MKTSLLGLLVTVLFTQAPAASPVTLNGTWSGNWSPKGGVPDAVTVELKQEQGGKLTGKFLTPVPMELTKASFNPATGVVMLEATNSKSGKLYKLDGKVKGTELTGTLTAGDATGEVRLIKWTFFGR